MNIHEQNRAKNIAANEEFLKQLGFGASTSSSNTTTTSSNNNTNNSSNDKVQIVIHRNKYDDFKDEAERPAIIKRLTDSSITRVTSSSSSSSSIILHRDNQLEHILSYLDRNFTHAPPLVVIGPSGIGKTHICTLALSSSSSCADMPTACVNCYGVSSSKQLIRDIWYSIEKAINISLIDIVNNNDSSSSNSSNSSKNDRKTSQITVDSLVTIKVPNNYSDLVLLLKKLLDKIEPYWPCIIIFFDQISDADKLENELSLRLLNLSTLSHPNIKIIATTRRELTRSNSYITIIMNHYQDNQILDILLLKARYMCYKSLAIITDKSTKERIENNLISIYSSILKEALPSLCMITKHIGELWEQTHTIGKEIISFDITDSSISIEKLLSIPDSVSTTIINEAANSVKQLPLSRITNPKRKSSQKKASATYDKILHSVKEKINIETFLATDWDAHLSMSMRYLLIAAFLASNNRKETDANTFGNIKKSKRRKLRAGQEEEDETNSGKTFTLERLLSIYSQITCIGGIHLAGGEKAAQALGRSSIMSEPRGAIKEITEYYGDANIFSAVTTLVSQKYFVQGTGWSLEKPTYQCVLNKMQAEHIAKSLNFQLHFYLT